MRISKKERKENAIRFYKSYMNNDCKYKAIVIQSTTNNSNPNITRYQLLAVINSMHENPVIIAESSIMGIEGCFAELLGFIRDCPQMTYWDDGFNNWLSIRFGFKISYQDGLVIMLEKS